VKLFGNNTYCSVVLLVCIAGFKKDKSCAYKINIGRVQSTDTRALKNSKFSSRDTVMATIDNRTSLAMEKSEELLRVDDIIKKFLLNTTRLRPRLTPHKVLAAKFCVIATTIQPRHDEEAGMIPLTTGSVAEFYIEPMHECFGDIDVMLHDNTELAIPRGHSPPTQLPDEFHNYVHVHEIIDSHFPGYVYLELRYLLTQCSDDNTYNAVEYDRGNYVGYSNRNDSGGQWQAHGPAGQMFKEGEISLDLVHCVRCLLWPSQAADWPARHRNYEWPDSTTVDRVVSDGCDLVFVAHRQCRQHEWMNTHQLRLSFSRAEIVLINSWMPLQQIVYHLLRVFLKTAGLTESTNNSGSGTLSNYHIKTLMLWACELNPTSWWTDNYSFTAICAELLHILSQWLNQRYCPHYFITECNLFDPNDRVNQILAAEQLSKIDQGQLIEWFRDSYLQTCCQRCPSTVLRLFDDISTSEKLWTATSAVVHWRQSNVKRDSWSAFELTQTNVLIFISKVSVSVRSYFVLMKELTKLDLGLRAYFISFVCLHIAHKISIEGSDKWMKFLAGMCDDVDWNISSLKTMKTSELVDFLQKSAVKHLTTFRQIEARDFGSVATIVTTDFEAMYAFKRGDYQHCLQLSTHNVRTLLYAVRLPDVLLLPEIIQLLDDDIVSLTALTLIVNPECRDDDRNVLVTQLTLSLYLMTQCQLKLRHPVTSLAPTLDYIEVVQRRHPLDRTLDHLTLKLAERKILTHICI